MITFKCECGKSFKVDQRIAGKLGRCPGCGVTVRIPGREAMAPGGTDRRATPPVAPATVEVAPLPPEPRRGPAGSPGRPPVQGGQPETASLAAAAEAANANASAGAGFRNAGPSLMQGSSFPLLEILAGSAILLTIVLPWFAAMQNVVMSWDILNIAPGGVVAFIIVAWVIGLVSVILGLALREDYASLLHAILGTVGVLFLVILVAVFLGEARRGLAAKLLYDAEESGDMAAAMVLISWMEVLILFNALAWLGVVITTNLRLRLGDRQGVQVPQGIFALVFVIVSILDLVMVIYGFSETPRLLRSRAAGPLVVGILSNLANIAAGVLAGAHSLRTGAAAKTLSRVALALIYSALTASVIYATIGLAVMTGQVWDGMGWRFGRAGISLGMLNILLIVGPLFFLFCSGWVKWITYVASQPSQAPRAYPGAMPTYTVVLPPLPTVMPTPAQGSALEARLQNLAILRERGMVSEQEYAVKRARMLDDM